VAICDECNREMHTANGCIKNPIGIYKTERSKKPFKVLDPIPYGSETWWPEVEFSAPARCHDCAAKLGHYHHPRCDMEQCPHCHGQLVCCGGRICKVPQ
jgi:hypothetical protein